ncbi:hypothetical protein HY522_05095 [bacterium]|nr:hypothetical protein [bacterium]
MNLFELAMKEVFIPLTAAKTRFCLIGGLAVALHRIPRATLDFDLAIFTSDLDTTLSVLFKRGFGVMAMVAGKSEPVLLTNPKAIQTFLNTAKPRAVKVYHPKLDLAGDIWFEPTVPMGKLLKSARRISVQGVALRVAAADDLIRMKEAALADDPSRPQDRADIAALKQSGRKGSRKRT